jgi:LMBR1 domain-containing protein 1
LRRVAAICDARLACARAQVFGIWLSFIDILMLPLDIANGDVYGIIPMDILWQVVLITSVIWSLVIVPFAQLYYEAEDPLQPHKSQAGAALKIMLLGGVVAVVIVFVAYLFLSIAEIPVIEYTAIPFAYNGTIPDPSAVTPAGTPPVTSNSLFVEFRVSIVLFLISVYTFLGTCCLAFFGGIGLSALPMDMINEFRFR